MFLLRNKKKYLLNYPQCPLLSGALCVVYVVLLCTVTTNYRIYPAIRRGFCPFRKTSNI